MAVFSCDLVSIYKVAVEMVGQIPQHSYMTPSETFIL